MSAIMDKEDNSTRKIMAELGLDAILHMLFVDNFIHAGNVFIFIIFINLLYL
jgi:predicted unusual protein kinase regulating ubiquinone biosynthesis (AarF/ABC1/UbiB family)